MNEISGKSNDFQKKVFYSNIFLKRNRIISKLGKIYSLLCVSIIITIVFAISFFIASKGLALFIKDGISVKEFFLCKIWQPEGEKTFYGAFSFIWGSLCVTILSVLVSAPLSIGAAIFMSEILPGKGEKILQPIIELLVGIPSVVYGYIGLTIIVPWIRIISGKTGFSLLSGVIVLSIMILPTITSISYDSIKNLPNTLKEASYGLGCTRWQTIRNILIPAAKNNIMTAIVLGMARAFGEALAVQMVIGNTKSIPLAITDSLSTLTSVLTLEMTNTVTGSIYNDALWSMGLILMLMSFIFISLIRVLSKRSKF